MSGIKQAHEAARAFMGTLEGLSHADMKRVMHYLGGHLNHLGYRIEPGKEWLVVEVDVEKWRREGDHAWEAENLEGIRRMMDKTGEPYLILDKSVSVGKLRTTLVTPEEMKTIQGDALLSSAEEAVGDEGS